MGKKVKPKPKKVNLKTKNGKHQCWCSDCGGARNKGKYRIERGLSYSTSCLGKRIVRPTEISSSDSEEDPDSQVFE